MVRRRNVSEESAESTSIRPLFHDVFSESVNIFVDPHACIPFTRIRPKSESGVLRLVSMLGGDSTAGDDRCSSGIALGSDMPLVVVLNGTLHNFIHLHFKDQGFNDAEIALKYRSREEWYGIIDGLHRHAAITTLMDSHDEWSAFKWHVTVVKGGNKIERYRQLSRAQNARHCPSFYIELTFFDIISNLRVEYDRLVSIGKKPSGADVATSFDGNTRNASSTLKQMATTVARLPHSVITTIGIISNTEHPDICLSNPKFNRNGLRTVREVMGHMDCRVFRNFVNITSLKSATSFMNAKGEDGEEAQNCTLHRAKDICQQNGFKSIQYDIIEKQYDLSTSAIREEKKFLAFIESDKWPIEMDNLRSSLLKTTLLDVEITSNKGNDLTILKTLLESFRRHFPAIAAIKEAKYRTKIEIEKKQLHGQQRSKHITSDVTYIQPGDEDSNTNINELPIQQKSSEAIKSQPQKNDTDAPLREKNISCYNMRWQQYVTEVFDNENSLFDAVVTEPPPANSRSYILNHRVQSRRALEEIDREEVKTFSSFCKRVLKSGSYAVVIIPLYMHREMYESFSTAGFIVMPDPYLIILDQSSFPSRSLKDFPEPITIYALVAKMPGPHPADFIPDFDAEFHQLRRRSNRRAALMSEVPAPKFKLCRPNSKSPFRSTERSPELMAELLDLFTPQAGRVMDPYAGTLTTAIAAVTVGRECVCVERESSCFETAMVRLRNYTSQMVIREKVFSNDVLAMTEKNQSFDGTESDRDLASEDILSETEDVERSSLQNFVAEESSTERSSKRRCLQKMSLSEEREKHTVAITKGSKVNLRIEDEIIGHATLKSPTGDHVYERSIHGHELSNVESEDQHLVVVISVSINEQYKGLKYPYTFPTIDEVPNTLSEIHQSGVYVWDANYLATIS